MTKIGLLSDTHGYMDKGILDSLKGSDLIFHAGDVGHLQVIDLLEEIAPTLVVSGNIDPPEHRWPEYVSHKYDDFKVLMIHIAGKFSSYNQQVREHILSLKPKLLICGHSHILKIAYDKKNNLLYMNPGAAGQHGFHKMRTLVRFNIKNSRPEGLEVVELGNRGLIKGENLISSPS